MGSFEHESFTVDGVNLILERYISEYGSHLYVNNEWTSGNVKYISLRVRKKWPWNNEAQAILYTAGLVIKKSEKRLKLLMSQTLSGKIAKIKQRIKDYE